MPLKVFFMGTTLLGHQCLRAAVRCGQDVVGCASIPQTIQISYSPTGVKLVNYVDFGTVASELGVPCVPYDRGNVKAFIHQVAALKPDLILVAGWYYMVSKGLRDVASRGAVGIHASLLPKYRGGAPLVWAMIRGEKETGVSLFCLEDGVDTGDIIGQERFGIDESDTIREVLAKAEAASIRLVETCLPRMADGTAPRIRQNHTEATEYPQRSPKDGEIDWARPAQEIRNFIRAQTRPYPGAFTRIGGKKITLWDADIVDEGEDKPRP